MTDYAFKAGGFRDHSTIESKVAAQITKAWGLVTQAYTAGTSAITTLGNQKYQVSWSAPTIGSVSFPTVGTTSPAKPNLGNIPPVNVNFEGKDPVVSDVSIDNVDVPSYVEKEYNFSVPTVPTINWPTFSKDAPGVSSIVLPSAPNTALPDVPSLSDINIPSPPDYSIPEFEGELPVDDLTEPSLSFNWGESLYSSDLNTRLGDVLYDNLVSGGTGLDEETEQAIYDRAKSRNEEEEQSLLDNINDGMASKGFPLPSGAHASRVLEAENKILRTRTDLNNDILIQQSKLAQENTHFIIQEVLKLESVLIEYHNNAQTRAFQAAQFVVSTAVQQYGLRIEGYKAKLSAYQTLAQVYQVRIQGEIAKAEFYKAQIEGVSASVAIQQNMIAVYTAQVDGVKALMDIYRIQMEGANIEANIDKTRIEAFLGEVNAYVARVNAEAAKYEGYKAQITGEIAKAEMYKTDVEAYTAKVAGQKVIADINVSQAEAELSKSKIAVEVFNGYIAKFQAELQRAVAEVDAKIKEEGLEVDLYKAGVSRYAAELDALVKTALGKIEEVKNKADVSIRGSEVSLQNSLNQYQLSAESVKAAAAVAGQMASAAAASVNASLSTGYSDSDSYNKQEVGSESSSHSDSTSKSDITEDIHSYSE